MSNFLNGFVDELTKTAGPAEDLSKPGGQTMEVKPPVAMKPPKAPIAIGGQTTPATTMESKPSDVLAKTSSVGAALVASRVGKILKSKIKSGAKAVSAKAKSMGGKTKAQWDKLTPAQKRKAKFGGLAAGSVAGYGAGLHSGREKKAGDTVKAVLENAKGKNRPANDSSGSMVDQYGGGVGNFEGKQARPFNKKYNPTDMPEAFGKKR